MSFVQREIDRIGDALRQPQFNERYDELYAAQQALLWATEPTDFKSPYDMLTVTSTPEDSEGCREESDHFQS
jgi:hypothetical protein